GQNQPLTIGRESESRPSRRGVEASDFAECCDFQNAQAGLPLTPRPRQNHSAAIGGYRAKGFPEILSLLAWYVPSSHNSWCRGGQVPDRQLLVVRPLWRRSTVVGVDGLCDQPAAIRSKSESVGPGQSL